MVLKDSWCIRSKGEDIFAQYILIPVYELNSILLMDNDFQAPNCKLKVPQKQNRHIVL